MESLKLFYCTVILFFHLLLVTSENCSVLKQGFSLQLIDPFSPQSPFYNPNLRETERLHNVLQSDRLRLRYFNSKLETNSTMLVEPTGIRPGLLSNGPNYMVNVSVGSQAGYQTYYLQIDISSGLTWIQCMPCQYCFPQQPPVFDPSKSPTYGIIASNHMLCKPPHFRPNDNRDCEFYLDYGDGDMTKGVLSTDVFTFPNDKGDNTQVPYIIFGCANSAQMKYPLGGPTGILGLNLDPESFYSQATCDTSRRFSYCLANPGSTSPMTLRFGDDITWPPQASIQSTQFLMYPDDLGHYYLNLTEMSILNTRIFFQPGTFERKNGFGGFIIDSRTYYTWLTKDGYVVVRHALVSFFLSRQNISPVAGRGNAAQFDLCWDLPANADPASIFPSMTLHFVGGDLLLRHEQLFYVDSQQRQFCLAMFPELTGGPSVLGVYQQINTQFMYDMRLGASLTFASADCSHGS